MIKLNWKIWLLIFVLALSLVSIAPWKVLEKGVVITHVDKNSSEDISGLKTGMTITQINSIKITNLQDYSAAVNSIFAQNVSFLKMSIIADNNEYIFLKNITNNETLSILAGELPTSNIQTGLDLSGGARAMIRPNATLNDEELQQLIQITTQRVNVNNLKDASVRAVSDLNGNRYMLIEIAGATTDQLKDLSKQGKFEAKIGNQTVFTGDGDIAYIEKTGAQAGVMGCTRSNDGSYYCRFSFPVHLKQEAAERHANITNGVPLSIDNPEYLSQKLDIYLDGVVVDSLFISKDLKGKATPDISVQGGGTGKTKEEATKNAQMNMNNLQTYLITGSLPYELEIVKLDTISPNLGKQFTKNLILLGGVVFIIISLALLIKYRNLKMTGAVILTMFSEMFITLGLAAAIKWNLDAASIAGIIAGMGTGVNDQIVLIDESVSNRQISMVERIKRGFFIIVGAFFTIIAAMLPLFWAGAGMLKGFALTTILSVMVGILITRPAFSELLKKIQG